MAWDSPLWALAEIVTACAEFEEPVANDGGEVLFAEKLIVAMPLELQTHAYDDDSVGLSAAPPRQAAETTVMPVLHRLHLTVEVER
jgi:hypothetical protein